MPQGIVRGWKGEVIMKKLTLYVKTVRPRIMRSLRDADAPGAILSIHADGRPSTGRSGAGGLHAVGRNINGGRLIAGAGCVNCRLGFRLKKRDVCNVFLPVIVAPCSIDTLSCESGITISGGGSELGVRVRVFEYCAEDCPELCFRRDYLRLLGRGRMNGNWHAKKAKT
jgi:hypothetical protein